MEKFNTLIDYGVRESFSDIHLTGGHPLVFRRNGVIDFQKETKWNHDEVDDLVEEMLTPREMVLLKSYQSVDIGRSIHNIRVRINVFNTTRGLSLAVRLLPGTVPELGSLNLHPSLREFAHKEQGLFLICGATGCGKSTTLAAMIEEINRTRSAHIVTLEDPIEYRFKSRKSFIEQRELGTHIPSFDRGLYDVLREDPDVILVGELRDPETIRLTLNAVESGHMVLASLHASNSEDAVYRICNSFAQEAQDIVRHQLASTLSVLVVQRLKYLPRAGFRVPYLSILTGSTSVKGMIRDNRLAQLESAIQTGRADGMMNMDQYVADFIDQREFFTLPSENFKPSAESTTELVYTSRHMVPDSGIHREQPAPPKVKAPYHPSSPIHKPEPPVPPRGPLQPPSPPFMGESRMTMNEEGGWDAEPRYDISEDTPMAELIAQMKKMDS